MLLLPFYGRSNVLTIKKKKAIWNRRYCNLERTAGDVAEHTRLSLIYIIVLVFLPLLLTLKHFIRGRTHKGPDLWKALIEGPVEVG